MFPFVSLFSWAFEVSAAKLAEPLPRRWKHVQGVAARARGLSAIAGADADLLEAAAILHDVGYAPDIAHTGFHPLDGAVFLAGINAPERLVNLVARHSYAELEAEFHGLADEISQFPDEGGVIRDALWYCDQTTTPDGTETTVEQRHAEVLSRYGPGHVVTKFITEGGPELVAAVERTQRRIVERSIPEADTLRVSNG